MSSQPVGGETRETDKQGKAVPKSRFTYRTDKNEKFDVRNKDSQQSDDRSDNRVHLLDSDQSSAPFPNRGPFLASGVDADEGKRTRSEMFSNNMTASLPGGDQGQADVVAEMPLVTWEQMRDGTMQRNLERAQDGFSPNPHRLQKGVEDRFGKGQVDEDLD
jgi:hypothetical protein